MTEELNQPEELKDEVVKITSEVTPLALDAELTAQPLDTAMPVADVEVEHTDLSENNVAASEAPAFNLETEDEIEFISEGNAEEEEHDEDADTSELEDITGHKAKDYSDLSLDALIAEAVQTTNLIPKEAIAILQDIRPFFYEQLKLEKNRLLKEHTDQGGDADSFESPTDDLKNQFSLLFKNAQDSRAEERKRIEEEKLQNLRKKQEIIEKLRVITEQDETESSLDQVKELQKEWKSIRVIPRDEAEELWKTYIFYLDRFYDNHGINIELKNLDRTKNLEAKIDLCKKVDEIKEENNLKTAFILLTKYREEFRNIGPVPREFSEEIWERFKATCDAVFAQKKEAYNEILQVRQQNADKKRVLIEKAALIAELNYKSAKEWKEKSEELNALFEEWKQSGPVPKSLNEPMWREFRQPFKQFYDQKTAFFEQKRKVQNANVLVKEDLIRQANEIAENRNDYAQATKDLLNLQEAWKKSGSAPEKVSNALWKQFREANDRFFEKKKATFANKNQEETENLEKKEALILKVSQLLEVEQSDDIFNQLRELQKEWSSTGNVPFKKKDEINKRYNELTDKLYDKYKKDRSKLKTAQVKDHYASLVELPQGASKLQEEERKLSRKISFLKTEIDTWNNNIEFFATSKNADKLRNEIQMKIDKTQEQINKLVSELRVLRGVMKEQKA